MWDEILEDNDIDKVTYSPEHFSTGNIFLYKIKNGSKFSIGENRKTMFHVDQYFNWFQKLMWKWCFGIKVEDYSEE